MATATFYLLDDIGDAQLLPFICQQVSHFFRQGQRVLVMAEDQAQAEALDELLWQLPVDAFVPHHLSGEGGQGSPVEISWPQQANAAMRQVVINLATQAPSVAARAQRVVDVVPVETTQRAAARERFKQYRQFGLQPHTAHAELTRN
ncbi:DNA polymerase III subunit chi [Aliidiomarina maris]|uniref:DNA polymerase III chi subunit n=1 Tax=Aliidiomarina maris TaxID=531312 RepID=A0A327WUY7_9GAMM|nr:DNA polymerase III subunit chi [Aliidiomarina maris]RAJ95265.1 DNA polymerase III chi subunit [Aliidiomarina maris]RUO21038.1 DNA polymerase III subunit chi [Aliidiomarina maris]